MKGYILLDVPQRCVDCQFRDGEVCIKMNRKINLDGNARDLECPIRLTTENVDWKEEYIDLVRMLGVKLYGKERWFYQEFNEWYDRERCKIIIFDELADEISLALAEKHD